MLDLSAKPERHLDHSAIPFEIVASVPTVMSLQRRLMDKIPTVGYTPVRLGWGRERGARSQSETERTQKLVLNQGSR